MKKKIKENVAGWDLFPECRDGLTYENQCNNHKGKILT